MKLLLTSSGITNKSIAGAVLDLVGVPADKIRLIFIPTAANVEEGEKNWLINDLVHFQQQGYESIDIIDIAAVPKEIWFPRLQAANLICFGGGNEQFLARVMSQSGFADVVRDLLQDRVYVGISAGSMVAGEFLPKGLLQLIYPDDPLPGELEQPLALTHLNFVPHLNSPYFPKARKEFLESLPKQVAPIYALDDHSALKIVDEKIEVVTEGEYIQI